MDISDRSWGVLSGIAGRRGAPSLAGAQVQEQWMSALDLRQWWCWRLLGLC